MNAMVTFTKQGPIAEALVDNPPVNATSAGVRQGLVDAMQAFNADPALKVLIIRCAGRTFIAGADIKEFGKPMVGPNLTEAIAMIDASAKPVIAAVHGTVLGGGFEVALACHYRIADPATRFSAAAGWPEFAGSALRRTRPPTGGHTRPAI